MTTMGYKLTFDTGFAPNPFGGVLARATQVQRAGDNSYALGESGCYEGAELPPPRRRDCARPEWAQCAGLPRVLLPGRAQRDTRTGLGPVPRHRVVGGPTLACPERFAGHSRSWLLEQGFRLGVNADPCLWGDGPTQLASVGTGTTARPDGGSARTGPVCGDARRPRPPAPRSTPDARLCTAR